MALSLQKISYISLDIIFGVVSVKSWYLGDNILSLKISVFKTTLFSCLYNFLNEGQEKSYFNMSFSLAEDLPVINMRSLTLICQWEITLPDNEYCDRRPTDFDLNTQEWILHYSSLSVTYFLALEESLITMNINISS